MRVAPPKLVKLAQECEESAADLLDLWHEAVETLAVACGSLGDSPAAPAVREEYDTAVARAQDVVKGLGAALDTAVQSLILTAQDATRTDDAVADEMDRRRGRGQDGSGKGPHGASTGSGPDHSSSSGQSGNGGGHGAGDGAGNGGGRG